ncbi:hypothetical protein CLV76_1267 [Marivita geojedonensis]|nr:hypothetical protein CLV76_1267 [Marivita geojedonensis]
MIFRIRPSAKNLIFVIANLLIAAGATAETQNPYALNTTWETKYKTFNMSSFAYMDRNENGSYDLGDQPLAGIIFVLEKDGQELWRVASNENGFANFAGSRVTDEAPIYELGDYSFTALVPPDWRVTSGNTSQIRKFIDVPGASMGGGLDEMMNPVGLVPPKEIRGRAEVGTELRISGPGFSSHPIEISETGQFRITVPERGRYELTSGTFKRLVEIEEYPVNIGNLRETEPVSGRLLTLTFDEISQNELRKVPSGYGGLEWFNFNAMINVFAKSSRGYVNGATSGSFIAYNSSGHPGRISHPDGYDFVEVHLTGAWPDSEGETAIFEFWRGDKKVAEDQVTLSAYSPVRYAPHMSNITSVRISTQHYWQMVLDDLIVGLAP